jgi:hypothetical protein
MRGAPPSASSLSVPAPPTTFTPFTRAKTAGSWTPKTCCSTSSAMHRCPPVLGPLLGRLPAPARQAASRLRPPLLICDRRSEPDSTMEVRPAGLQLGLRPRRRQCAGLRDTSVARRESLHNDDDRLPLGAAPIRHRRDNHGAGGRARSLPAAMKAVFDGLISARHRHDSVDFD